MKGYVKLWRKSLESGLMQNHKLWVFWTWCLMKATHKPSKQMVGFQMVELHPGQFIFGRKAAAEELDMSERSIRTCLQKLQNLENVTIKATNKFSVITIVNWDTYQQEENQNDQQNANKRPANDQQVTTNKNVKNERSKDISSSKLDSCPHQDIIEAYHTILPEMRRVKAWTPTRSSMLKARWREDTKRQNIEWWQGFFHHIRGSPFLMGDIQSNGRPPFQADLEWLIRPQNFTKVIEGKYDS